MAYRRRVKRIKLLGIVVAVLGSFLMFLLWLFLAAGKAAPEAIAPMVGLPVFLGALIYISGWVIDGFHRRSAKHPTNVV